MLEIKKYKWNSVASPLTHFKIYRYIGPTILGKQADVELIYKNGKSVRIFGDQKEVGDEAIRRILGKKSPEGKSKFLISPSKKLNLGLLTECSNLLLAKSKP